jgi:REP element-mobilizing transposase RayT
LCGIDNYSGQSYEHRRGWVEKRLLFLSSVFAIDLCAYAVMSNHVHVVLHVDVKQTQVWSDYDTVQRWHRLHKGTLLTQMFARGDTIGKGQRLTLDNTITEYRRRLHDISWLMRNLNEHIARRANKEDECTGRFWEGRFKSQALLDEAALLSCMAYVDLNPIRTKIAKTPETSKHTSIKKRLESIKQNTSSHSLMPFVGNERQDMPKGIAFSLKDYCEIVDITGKIIRHDKAGHIDQQQQPILKRLGISDEQWLTPTTEFEEHFCYAAGAEQLMNQFKEHTGHQRIRGMGKAKPCYAALITSIN